MILRPLWATWVGPFIDKQHLKLERTLKKVLASVEGEGGLDHALVISYA